MKKRIFVTVLFVGSILMIGSSKLQASVKNEPDLNQVECFVDENRNENVMWGIIPPIIPSPPLPVPPTK